MSVYPWIFFLNQLRKVIFFFTLVILSLFSGLNEVSELIGIRESKDFEVRYTEVSVSLSWTSYIIFLSLGLFFFNEDKNKDKNIIEHYSLSYRIQTTNSVRWVALLSCE